MPAKKRSSAKSSKSHKPSAREQLTEYRKKRDFRVTAEPEGGAERTSTSKLQFVIQKHAASHLHFDLRLELDGVMKSWAVPKGPAPDPAIKRLAMQVEDHPMEYNSFEGTIPEGEYGGGTVMLWDVGTYEPEKGGGEDGVREGIEKGDLKIIFHGKRMKGSWVLVRTRGWGSSSASSKPSWLLIKHKDEHAERGDALVETHVTSVISKRTMDEIGGSQKKKVWHSNRASRGRWSGSSKDDAPVSRKKTISVAEARARRKAAAKSNDE
jgi:bifunctional non-homologous end joining protein LigD